jgi:RimJ/RimL family protein N-acetyltransferase
VSQRPELPRTARLRLRPLSVADVDAQLAGQDAEIIRWVSGRRSTRDEHLIHLVDAHAAWYGGAPLFDLGIELKGDETLVGLVGLQTGMSFLRLGQVNVTYALYPQWRGRGFASEAVEAAGVLAAQIFDVGALVIRTDPENSRSAALAVRLGYCFDHQTDDDEGLLDWYVKHM